MENLWSHKFEWDSSISLEFPRTDNITTDLLCPMDEILVWCGHELTWEYLKSISPYDRDEIAKDVLNFFIEYDFTTAGFVESDIAHDWQKLLEYTPKLEKIGDKTFISNSVSIGSRVYKSFFPNTIKTRSGGRRSIYDVLTDRVMLWKVIRNRMGNTLLYHPTDSISRMWPMDINPLAMITGSKNSGYASMGSIFKSAVAKTVYNRWVKAGGKVVDYSCGFGTRLLGLEALRNGAVYYGFEPNPETFANLNKMIDYFGFDAHILQCGSEEVWDWGEFDFAFSSPPYFNAEWYSDIGQCYLRFPEYNQWLEGYWRATIRNIYNALKSDGILGVNVGGQGNAKMVSYETDMRRIIEEEGFILVDEWWMKTSRSHLSGKKNTSKVNKLEGIFFYRKG